MTFPVGTRVVVTKLNEGIPAGMTGTVCREAWAQYNGEYVGVEFDSPEAYIDLMHDCSGTCEYGRGRYIYNSCLAVLEPEQDFEPETDEEFDKFLGI